MDEDARTLLARIDERTGFILEHLKAIDEKCEKHDTRIGRMEGWRNRIIGAFGVVAFVLSAYGYILFSGK